MNKKFYGLLLAGALCMTALTGCGGAADTNTTDPAADAPATEAQDTAVESDLEKITNAGELKIGYTVYDPMNYTDENGEFVGFDTELAEAVCEKLGVEPNFIEIVWDTKQIELESGNIDCIWNGMTITDDLKAAISISDPYAVNKQVIVTKSENKDTYADLANLKGKTVALEAGSAAQSLAEEDENLKDNLVTVAKQTDALLEVQSGTSDAAIFDSTMADNMIGEGTDFADLVVCSVFHEEQYGIGFRKDSDLTAKVNEILGELREDGTMTALSEKYGITLAE